MKLGYEQIIEQSQRLAMTPELIQAIQILQYNSQDLREYVDTQLLENPMLEPAPSEDKSSDLQLYEVVSNRIAREEYYENSFKSWENDPDGDSDFSFEKYISEETNLYDFLREQLAFSKLSRTESLLGEYLINEIDENGYLRITVEEITENIDVSVDMIEKVIGYIQSFEPLGVCARSLKECLLIQLKGKGLLNLQIEELINEHLEHLGSNKIAQIAKEMGIKPESVQKMADLIKTLDPKPGSKFSSGDAVKYVIPDLSLEIENNNFILTLTNDSVPQLMISSYYKKLSKEIGNDENVAKYFSERFNAAVLLIKNIEQRKSTIYNVADMIIKQQKDFFLLGDKYMKILTLRDVSSELGIHESTVSRAVNGKYIQTPKGLFELKYFFSSGIPQGDDGISSNSIKSFIRDFVQDEDPKKPLSDQKIAEMLLQKGIDVKRRTIAKYRESLNIPSSSKRRRF